MKDTTVIIALLKAQCVPQNNERFAASDDYFIVNGTANNGIVSIDTLQAYDTALEDWVDLETDQTEHDIEQWFGDEWVTEEDGDTAYDRFAEQKEDI